MPRRGGISKQLKTSDEGLEGLDCDTMIRAFWSSNDQLNVVDQVVSVEHDEQRTCLSLSWPSSCKVHEA